MNWNLISFVKTFEIGVKDLFFPFRKKKKWKLNWKIGIFELETVFFTTENHHKIMEGKAPLTYEIASTFFPTPAIVGMCASRNLHRLFCSCLKLHHNNLKVVSYRNSPIVLIFGKRGDLSFEYMGPEYMCLSIVCTN